MLLAVSQVIVMFSGEGASAVAGDWLGWVTTGQGEWGISIGITVAVVLSLWNSRSGSSFHAVTILIEF